MTDMPTQISQGSEQQFGRTQESHGSNLEAMETQNAQNSEVKENISQEPAQDVPTVEKETKEDELKRYQALFRSDASTAHQDQDILQNVPLLKWGVKRDMEIAGTGPAQYAVMGHGLSADTPPGTFLLNTNSPWSFFLCGSQGSGKSHTPSCILENCMLDGAVGVCQVSHEEPSDSRWWEE
ncbi:hypothetical protein CC86DRAFT_381552 [Ophiobolus disseminans]|uniref:Uncharacterized protein n=1 Tax=Ophiobolus disseminans TaxID=1469910 RepID=A0A6A7A349_9PLEO|nr:hypothetical protein CC86DRAFT_381552 [Ophiobolus disseminans]